MHVIEARNVNDAFRLGVLYLNENGEAEESRNGPVIVAPGPVTTVYAKPQERVLFSETRDANPFFHLYEAIWILAGKNDVDSVANFAVRMREYSDNGTTLRGAYGYRLRSHFGFDQVRAAADELRRSRSTRRAVSVMYDPNSDGNVGWKDAPCNTHIYWRARGALLDMTVCCRSNDIVWGAYGANAVHFSVVHEIVAALSRLQPGFYRQVSNNFHAYPELVDWPALVASARGGVVEYAGPATPLVKENEKPLDFIEDCERYCAGNQGDLKTAFMRDIARPFLGAHAAWRSGSDPEPLMETMPPCDWRAAGRQWFARRRRK